MRKEKIRSVMAALGELTPNREEHSSFSLSLENLVLSTIFKSFPPLFLLLRLLPRDSHSLSHDPSLFFNLHMQMQPAEFIYAESCYCRSRVY